MKVQWQVPFLGMANAADEIVITLVHADCAEESNIERLPRAERLRPELEGFLWMGAHKGLQAWKVPGDPSGRVLAWGKNPSRPLQALLMKIPPVRHRLSELAQPKARPFMHAVQLDAALTCRHRRLATVAAGFVDQVYPRTDREVVVDGNVVLNPQRLGQLPDFLRRSEE